MKKHGFIILLIGCFFGTAVFSQEKAVVDYISDVTQLVKQGDSTLVKLTGNVAFYHNGAFITCDSAYRYSERRIEGIGNVVINQDQLYIYGDKIVYNGETNMARVYSPLIKVVDSTAVMYTYNMIFNTDTQVCEYFGGATISSEDNTMESKNGFYHSKSRDIVLRNSVEIANDDYEMANDELNVNLNTEKVMFDVETHIWSRDGHYLQADKGDYVKPTKVYHFEKNSYILTDSQEGWADTMVYYSAEDEVMMRRNIQMDDREQQASSFGDYAYYWNRLKNAVLTERPTVVMYDGEERDSTFVSADTILVRPFLSRIRSREVLDSLRRADSLRVADSIGRVLFVQDSMRGDSVRRALLLKDSLALRELHELLYSYGYDSSGVRTLVGTPALKERFLVVDEERNYRFRDTTGLRLVADSLKALYFSGIDTLPRRRTIEKSFLTEENVPTLPKSTLDSVFEGKDIFRLKGRDFRGIDRRIVRAIKQRVKDYKLIYADSLEEVRRQKRRERILNLMNSGALDSVRTDSTAVDTARKEPAKAEIIEVQNIPDSGDYLIRARWNARIFREDMQAVSDSIIVETVDSTMTMQNHAIAWNGVNQIAAERIRTYVVNGELNRSRLFGKPIISQFVEADRYSQLTGDYMDALYRDNYIYKLLVNTDSRTIYYMQETDSLDNSKYVAALLLTTSKNMVIDIEDSAISRIKWIGSIQSTTYPIEKVPPTVEQRLPGFVWYDSIRPSKIDVFDRIVRASERERVDSLQKPLFPLTEQIEREKNRLLQQGIWRDRDEKIRVTEADFQK